MKTGMLVVLAALVGAAVVWLTSGRAGRYQHIGHKELEADNRVGLISGEWDKVFDTSSGRIYRRGWTVFFRSNRVEQSVSFEATDPVGMTTATESRVFVGP